jgi:hypothetical protein
MRSILRRDVQETSGTNKRRKERENILKKTCGE